jgi:hypothetical protein
MKTAIVFLTDIPKKNTIKFAQEIEYKLHYDVFIVVDNNDVLIDVADLHIIQVNDSKTWPYINSNISNNSTHIKKNPIAMDKFLYSFCDIYTDYDFIWVFEDDVFIPSIYTIEMLHNKYNSYDLVAPNHFIKKDRVPDWHWRSIFPLFPNREKPFYYSMTCALGVSRNVLNAIKDYAYSKESLFYTEVMFNTLAEDNNFKVINPLELKSVVWQGKWDIDEFLLLRNNVFHPRKDIDNHYNLREKIWGYSLSCYQPKNNLPDFIKKLL